MTELELIDIFGDNLRGMLDEVGITQEQLAKEMGVTKGLISKYVNKERMPSLRNVINMCCCLDCDFEDLIPIIEKIEY